jgi:hypothetical protein
MSCHCHRARIAIPPALNSLDFFTSVGPVTGRDPEGQAVAVFWPHVHGSQLHGLQVQLGFAHVASLSPQLQSTQVHGSQAQFGLLQVLVSVVLIK